MRFGFFAIIILLCISSCTEKDSKHILKPSEIQKYKIELPKSLIKSSGGFYPAIGSGITFHKLLTNNDLEFFAISDRGPNFPLKEENTKIIMFHPNFSPKIVRVIVTPNVSAVAKDFIDIEYKGSRPSNTEDFVDTNLKNGSPKVFLDTEGISLLKDGNFVVGDEYHPSISIVNKNGKIIKMLTPGNGLPEILKHRSYNRGFESVAVTPNGKIFAILEGALDFYDESKKNIKIIRIVEIDLEHNTNKMYLYPFDHKAYPDARAIKIGDITAVDDQNFLVVEQGTDTKGVFQNLIYKINLQDATDVSGMKLANGKDLEYGNLEDLSHLKFVSKKLRFDPRQHGWTHEKLEGLTIVNPYTIAITNDNDFALSGYEIKDNPNGSKTASPVINEESNLTNLWIIKFAEKI